MNDVILGQNRALELALQGAPLGDVLGVLVETTELFLGKGNLAAILLAQDEKSFADLRARAAQLDLTASHLFPIHSWAKGVLGHLVICSQQARPFSPPEQSVIDLAARTAALVIEREQGSADLENRRLAEEALARSERQLKLITDRLPDFIAYIDSQGRYQFTNRAYQEWFALRPDELLGRTRAEFASAETAAKAAPFERRALAGEAIRYENVIQSPSGETMIVDAEYLPDRDPVTGEVRGAVLVGHDITDLRKVTNALEDAVRVRDEFLSLASHELRTPLTSIRLQTQMTKRNVEQGRAGALDPVKVLRAVEQMDRSALRLLRVVDDMLDITRIATGKLDFTFERFDLSQLAKEVVERLAPQAEAASAKLSVRADEPVIGLWDRFRLDQVITNLLTNALRYAHGSPVEVVVSSDGISSRLSVRDWGPGIAEEHQVRIFQRFERATSNRANTGLGLGLYICREIVERHGGQVRVESRPGEGATFIVELPPASPGATAY